MRQDALAVVRKQIETAQQIAVERCIQQTQPPEQRCKRNILIGQV
ncbi:hypothetical protein [Pseudotabrizicola sp. 4114]|nr:hypothetical protein [Pseudorhodobacter sp. 4114]